MRSWLQGPSLSGGAQGPDVEGRNSVAAVFASLSLSICAHAPALFLRAAWLLLALLHEHGDGRT